MSPPSIAFPPLPPNLFFTLLLSLTTLTTPASALTPLHTRGLNSRVPSNASNTNNTPNTTTTTPKPLAKWQIASLVLGILVGAAALVCVATALTNVQWCREKVRALQTKRRESEMTEERVKEDWESTASTVAEAERRQRENEYGCEDEYRRDLERGLVVRAVPVAHVDVEKL